MKETDTRIGSTRNEKGEDVRIIPVGTTKILEISPDMMSTKTGEPNGELVVRKAMEGTNNFESLTSKIGVNATTNNQTQDRTKEDQLTDIMTNPGMEVAGQGMTFTVQSMSLKTNELPARPSDTTRNPSPRSMTGTTPGKTTIGDVPGTTMKEEMINLSRTREPMTDGARGRIKPNGSDETECLLMLAGEHVTRSDGAMAIHACAPSVYNSVLLGALPVVESAARDRSKFFESGQPLLRASNGVRAKGSQGISP
jgi:hypothetical protein